MDDLAHRPPTDTGSLGAFLRSRRAALTPEAAGIASYGRRRVPGLRREELAQLAGVSATYYARLEQGQTGNASVAVLDALAGALGLDDDERRHLHDLARPLPPPYRDARGPEHATPDVIGLLAAMREVPAILLGRRNDILAWNRLGHLLVGGHHDITSPEHAVSRPNLVRMLFLDPHARELYVDWQGEAARAVASLRALAGRFRDDHEFAALIGELSLESDEFATLWSEHPVRDCTGGTKSFRHPLVGHLEASFTVLQLADEGGQRLVTYTAAEGSPSAAALRLLASHALGAPGSRPRVPCSGRPVTVRGQGRRA